MFISWGPLIRLLGCSSDGLCGVVERVPDCKRSFGPGQFYCLGFSEFLKLSPCPFPYLPSKTVALGNL